MKKLNLLQIIAPGFGPVIRIPPVFWIAVAQKVPENQKSVNLRHSMTGGFPKILVFRHILGQNVSEI